MTGVLIIKRNLDTETQIGGRWWEEAQEEDGHRQTKEGGLEQILLSQPSEGTDSWFWTSSLQKCEKTLLLLKPPSLWCFVRVALKNEYSNRRRKRMIDASSLGGERVYEYHWITLQNRLIWHDEWKQKNLKQFPNVYLKYVKEDLETPRSEV